MKPSKSKVLYKSKRRNKKDKLGTRKQRGAGGCWGGLCSTNNPTVNDTAHVSRRAPSGEEEIHMQQNPMFKVVPPSLGTAAKTTVYSQAAEGQVANKGSVATVPTVPRSIQNLTWLWETAEYRFTKMYTKEIINFKSLAQRAIEYIHGTRDVIRKANYSHVIFVLKTSFPNNKQMQVFLERASNSIDTFSEQELDLLNNFIVRDYNRIQTRTLKEKILEDFKGSCYVYSTNLVDPTNRPYAEEITNLFERLIVFPTRGLLTILERDLQPVGTDVSGLVEGQLMAIRGTVNRSVGLTSLIGGRSRKTKSKRKKNRQRGSGGCFGWGCSVANTGVNEGAHVAANPLASATSANPSDILIQELENLSLQQVELQSLEIEQMDLESKQGDGLINVQEQERLNTLQSGEKARKNQLSQLNARFRVLSAQVQRLTAALTA